MHKYYVTPKPYILGNFEGVIEVNFKEYANAILHYTRDDVSTDMEGMLPHESKDGFWWTNLEFAIEAAKKIREEEIGNIDWRIKATQEHKFIRPKYLGEGTYFVFNVYSDFLKSAIIAVIPINIGSLVDRPTITYVDSDDTFSEYGSPSHITTSKFDESFADMLTKAEKWRVEELDKLYKLKEKLTRQKLVPCLLK